MTFDTFYYMNYQNNSEIIYNLKQTANKINVPYQKFLYHFKKSKKITSNNIEYTFTLVTDFKLIENIELDMIEKNKKNIKLSQKKHRQKVRKT